jgi:hypothetical protein
MLEREVTGRLTDYPSSTYKPARIAVNLPQLSIVTLHLGCNITSGFLVAVAWLDLGLRSWQDSTAETAQQHDSID